MFLSRMFRMSLSTIAGLALAVVLFAGAQPAQAQQFRRFPTITKGYQLTQITQQNLQIARRSTEPASPSAPATYEVVQPAESSLPRVVTFQGPDGEPRTFVLEGTVRTAQPRRVLVRLTSK